MFQRLHVALITILCDSGEIHEKSTGREEIRRRNEPLDRSQAILGKRATRGAARASLISVSFIDTHFQHRYLYPYCNIAADVCRNVDIFRQIPAAILASFIYSARYKVARADLARA